MRYSIYINQVRCVEWGIKPALGSIVDLINQASSWAEALVMNGLTYYWIEPSKVAEELIAEEWKRDTARRHMNTLKEKGVIDLVVMNGKYYVRLTEKGATWNQSTPIRETKKNSSGENNHTEPRKKIRETAKKNSADKYIQDQYNQDHNPPLPPQGEVVGVEQNSSDGKFNPETVELPDYVDRTLWIGYCRMRKAKTNSAIKTQETAEYCLKRLAKLSGGSLMKASEVLEQSIANTWTGLFELKQTSGAVNAHDTSGAWAVGRRITIKAGAGR